MITGLFLQGAALGDDALAGGLLAFFAAFMLFFVIVMVASYIFMSWAFMSLARKANYSSPGIAWIPVIGPALICAKTAKMHWWPVLLLIGAWIPILGGLLGIVFTVFFIIWLWKTYEYVGKPGWWAILYIIPIVGLIFLGIAAWSKK